jgi:diguanylate cyclase (GGDEF)-like protein
LAGDEVLKETARRLVSSVRSYDFVGRFGGEEFLVTLNNCDPAFGLARTEKIRKTIAESPVETSAGPVPISISFGLLLSQEWGYMSVVELLHEVDTALYGAKAAGRNCVKLAAPKAQPDVAREFAPEPAWRRR